MWVSDSDIFLNWIKFFCEVSLPYYTTEVFINSTHAVLDNAFGELSVTPHYTHKLQPLDLSVYAPITTYFERAMDKYQKQHLGQCITLLEIGEIFRPAYLY